MKVGGEKTLASRPEKIWSALHDAEALANAIPGGATVRQTGEGVFTVAVETSVMGMMAVYEGEVRFVDESPDSRCRVLISGGGPLGSVSGNGELWLTESGDGTVVKFDFEADVGEGLGWLGGGALGGVVKKMVEGFLEAVDAG